MTGGGRKSDEEPRKEAPESEDSGVFDWLPLDNEPPAPPPPLATPQAKAPPTPPPPASPPPLSALWALPSLPGFDEDETPAVPPHRIVPMPPPAAKKAVPAPEAPKPTSPAAPKPPTPPAAVRPAAHPAPAHAHPQPPPVAPARAHPVSRVPQGRRASPFSLPLIPLLALAALLIAAGATYVVLRTKPPRVSSATPLRVRPGQKLTIRGENFGARPQDNDVRFDGRPGRVISAAVDALEVEVPAGIATAPGRDMPISVSVSSNGRQAGPLKVSAFQAPVIRSLTPEVAMPGEEIVVGGGGWGPKVEISFAGTKAELVEVTPESVRVRVPQLPGAPGTAVQVVAASGAERSEPAAFLLGHLPLLLSIEPESAAPGDVVTLKGKGFDPRPAENRVEVAGARALVLASREGALEVVVPFPRAGSTGGVAVEVRVPGYPSAGSGSLGISGGVQAKVPFRFVALPLTDAPGHDHALVATELGPAFVLSGSAGRTAAERAFEAQRRLNEAVTPLSTPEETPLEIREAEGVLAIGLKGSATPLLEVTAEDAAAYNESGPPFRGNAGRSVTRGRLAAWWLALTRDVTALLAADRRPRAVALLTAEGKALTDLHDTTRRHTTAGIPRADLAELRPEALKSLQALALRVPPTVVEGSGEKPAAAPVSSQAADDPLELEGQWSGTVVEDGIAKPVRASFADGAGELTYMKPLQVTVPLREVVRPRLGSVRFAVQTGSRTRYFLGAWDGEMLAGAISSTADGQSPVGRFELRR
ncbi:MAG: IPT/TIG domain-containing protein [Vicinamibacteria bacterium]